MQVIVSLGDNLAKYVLPDATPVVETQTTLVLPEFTIGDLNTANTLIFEGVEDVPGDWCGNWYAYDGLVWTMVPQHPLHPEHPVDGQ